MNQDRLAYYGGKITIQYKEKKLYQFIKRILDIVLSFLFLILSGWFILLMMLIKLLEDGKCPIYISYRVGKDGRLIRFHKIRTMILGAEEERSKLIQEGLNESQSPVFKMKNDPRITPFGHFLRKTCIDELPQLFDVFMGRLSLVGPRSPLKEETLLYNDYQKQRLLVKGGLLCFWQNRKDRYTISFDEWVKLDLKYIENRSLWLDFKILLHLV